MVGISQHELAAKAGVSQPAVFEALKRGLLDTTGDGKIDPDGPRTVAWLDNRNGSVIKIADKRSAPIDERPDQLAERSASLESREYDLSILRANVVERCDLAEDLYDEADRWEAVLRRFPTECGGRIAGLMRMPPDRFVPRLESAMTVFLRLRGDQRQVVDHSLDQAALRWHQIPLHQLRGPPPPLFERPGNLVDAHFRYSDARRDLARLRMGLRAGTLLVRWAAEEAAEVLRINWIQGGQDEFCDLHGGELLAAAGIRPEHGLLWGLWMVAMEHFAVAFEPLWPTREIMHPGKRALEEARAFFEAVR